MVPDVCIGVALNVEDADRLHWSVLRARLVNAEGDLFLDGLDPRAVVERGVDRKGKKN